MAKTVTEAFKEFMRDSVDLPKWIVDDARKSSGNLLSNIASFNGDSDFLRLYQEYNECFGSFARKTKCRELDDVDLMVGLHAEGAIYDSSSEYDNVTIWANMESPAQKACANPEGTLNSRKVLERFKAKLWELSEYKKPEIHRNKEAVVLGLCSKQWTFDIVPCFKTIQEIDGRDYYLIPNGRGNWKKTDPREDRKNVQVANQLRDGRILDVIRLCKVWNRNKQFSTIPSYLLESIITHYAIAHQNWSINMSERFKEALYGIYLAIQYPVYDLKKIQGDLNTLSSIERAMVQNRAWIDYEKTRKALEFEENGDNISAIRKWGEIFGERFPVYG